MSNDKIETVRDFSARYEGIDDDGKSEKGTATLASVALALALSEAAIAALASVETSSRAICAAVREGLVLTRA
jgi:hypothetical protein